MRHLVSYITGTITVLSILFPASASAFNIQWFDTASGNGSLFERIADGTIEPRVREIQTVKDLSGKPVLDDVGYAKNMNELWQYAKQFSCAAKLDSTVCRTAAK